MEGASVERVGIRVRALLLEQPREVVERVRCAEEIADVRRLCLSVDAQRLAVQSLRGLGVAAIRNHERQRRQRLGGTRRMISAVHTVLLLAHRERSAQPGLRRLVVALVEEPPVAASVDRRGRAPSALSGPRANVSTSSRLSRWCRPSSKSSREPASRASNVSPRFACTNASSAAVRAVDASSSVCGTPRAPSSSRRAARTPAIVGRSDGSSRRQRLATSHRRRTADASASGGAADSS
mmetsp:Transcript_15011/g.60272  ORF Transcript_15011/g.60272 Transcript_15011/m.60272 type:complete len:238 (+) Transcript_15011:386-1099(+)